MLGLVGADQGDQLHPALQGDGLKGAEAVLELLAAWEAEDLRHDIAQHGDHGYLEFEPPNRRTGGVGEV